MLQGPHSSSQLLKEYEFQKKQLAEDPLMALYEEVLMLRKRVSVYESVFTKIEDVLEANGVSIRSLITIDESNAVRSPLASPSEATQQSDSHNASRPVQSNSVDIEVENTAAEKADNTEEREEATDATRDEIAKEE